MKKLNLTEGMCSANSNATSQFQCHSLTCVGLMNEAVSKSLQEAMFSDKSRTTCQSQCHGPTCVDLISKAGLAHIYIYIYIYIYICVHIYIYRERDNQIVQLLILAIIYVRVFNICVVHISYTIWGKLNIADIKNRILQTLSLLDIQDPTV